MDTMGIISLELTKINDFLNAHKLIVWLIITISVLLFATYMKLRSTDVDDDNALMDWCCFIVFIIAMIGTCICYYFYPNEEFMKAGYLFMGLTILWALYRTGLLRLLFQMIKIMTAVILIVGLIGRL